MGKPPDGVKEFTAYIRPGLECALIGDGTPRLSASRVKLYHKHAIKTSKNRLIKIGWPFDIHRVEPVGEPPKYYAVASNLVNDSQWIWAEESFFNWESDDYETVPTCPKIEPINIDELERGQMARALATWGQHFFDLFEYWPTVEQYTWAGNFTSSANCYNYLKPLVDSREASYTKINPRGRKIKTKKERQK